MTSSNGNGSRRRGIAQLRHLYPSGTKRSARPYRDSLLIYAAFGALVIVIGVATGGDVLRVVIAGVAAFLLATGMTWRALRRREREQEQEQG